MNYLLALQTLPVLPPSPEVNFGLILPELIIGVAGVLVMLLDAFVRPAQRWVTGSLSLAGLCAAAVAAIWMWLYGPGLSLNDFNGMIVFDELRLSFTLIFLLVSALTVLI
ncbi:MAG TPA: hypothetical protein VEQ40_03520, partial [Pyrinomonadaceae bacterium]|nr:hypothetical protein [Pyrinomonadaceae bacterium]